MHKFRYAGIGSRETPKDVCQLMANIASALEMCGGLLRSGAAEGADEAFEAGVANPSDAEIYLPFEKFRDHPSKLWLPDPIPEKVAIIGKQFHPRWDTLDPRSKQMIARDGQQALGQFMNTPVDFVICWTPDGATRKTTSATGGTGQVIRIAAAYKIPVFNLKNTYTFGQMQDYLQLCFGIEIDAYPNPT
jgi:hypothetical protein